MSSKWKSVAAKGDIPTARYGHGMAVSGDAAYVIAGNTGTGALLGDAYKLDLTSFTWSKVAFRGNALPSKREGHSLTTVGNSLFLFGGVDEKDQGQNDIFAFDVATSTCKLVLAPNAPTPRNNHAACAYMNKLYVFGGFNDGNVLNDLFAFDTERNGWQSIEARGTKPPARCDATLTAVGNKLVLFGGAADGVWFNDVHVYDVDTKTWTAPRASGTPPPQRDYHTAVTADRQVAIFGGTCETATGTTLFNDVFFFNVDTLAWTKGAPAGSVPSARWGHAAVSYRGEVIVFGGCGTAATNDVCILDLGADEPVPLPKPSRPVPQPGVPTPSARPLPSPAPPAKPSGLAPMSATRPGPSGSAPSPTTPAPAARPMGAAPTPGSAGNIFQAAANANPANLKLTGNLAAPPTLSQAKANYATHTPIPAPRKPAPSIKARETTTKDYAEHLTRSKNALTAIYTEVEHLFADLDAERAQLDADKKQFQDEKRINQEQYDQQQAELKALAAKLQKDNETYMAQIQAQYEEKLNEIKKKHAELKVEEDSLRVQQEEFDERKKKLDVLVNQFSVFKS